MVWKSVISGLFGCALAFAQPAFEAASVRVLDTSEISTRPTRTPGRIVWSTDFWRLISYAWNMPEARVGGSYSNLGTYRIEATMSPAATEVQVRRMMRTLLETRFKLVAHIDAKEVDGFALTIGKNGFKVKESPDDPATPAWVVGTQTARNVVQVEAHRGTIQQLVERLHQVQNQMVWDQTGLTGNYDFKFRYAMNDDLDAAAPTLTTALRDLGLDYKKHRGSVEWLIVDSIQKTPTEN